MSPSLQPTSETIARHDRFMSRNYPRFDVEIVRGEGSLMWDDRERRYIDLFAGFGAGLLGHCHPELVEAVTRQAGELWHVGNLFHSRPQTELAEAIARLGFDGRSFFCHSGADANEAAIKLARLYGKLHPGRAGGEHGRFKVISTNLSFHGRSFATMGATGSTAVRKGFAPLPPGFVNVSYDDVEAVRAQVEAVED